MKEQSETNFVNISHSQRVGFSILSLLLGGGALWYAWIRYTNLISRVDENWYGWINPSMIVLFGLACFWAAFLFITRNTSALSFFKLGLSIIPLTLFTNLVILVIRVIGSLLQGNTAPLIDRILSQPHKFLLIPIVIIAMMLLSAFTNAENQKTK